MTDNRRVHIIGCAVTELDFAAVAARLGLAVSPQYLEAGLHADPGELRRRLQEAVDQASANGRYDRLVIGYGLCGRGTVDLEARAVPLVVPRVHDCIALFLGSNLAYREQFSHCPGTYYTAAGWYERQVQPRGATGGDAVKAPLPQPDFPALCAKYGAEHARAIVHFLTSWQRNYRRSVFIDTGAGDPAKYAAYAQALAAELGWRYEAVKGSQNLFELLLTATASGPDVLLVPPGHVTRFDARENRLVAVPLQTAVGAAATTSAAVAPPPTTAAGPAPERRARLGLGIDAGGTYTDAVLYEFAAPAVRGTGKALTTKWDYTIGITNAIATLDRAALARVDFVAVSTTLATNAIVEGRGQRVGLLLLPTGDAADAAQVAHQPTVTLRGRLNMTGVELEPVDAAEVLAAGRQLVADGVRAFAVSGYGATVNPQHETAIRHLLRDAFGLPVVCGHEFSDRLDFYVRANTAVLNARIIPILERFLGDVRRALEALGVRAPLAVVRSDGSLMRTELAVERPIETLLSGPAASVAGARYLTAVPDALIVDMGGTTSDLAAVRDGCVRICADGANIGGWRTHVRALDIRTVGLGGDSQIALDKGTLRIGPQRVAPLCWLASTAPAAVAASLEFVARHAERHRADTRPLQFLARGGQRHDFAPTAAEAAVIRALEAGPCSVAELTVRLGARHWQLLNLGRLEEHDIVVRCGLTPTDILHAQERLALWDRTAAVALTAIFARLRGSTPAAFAADVVGEIERALASQLLKKELDEEQVAADRLDECAVCQALVARALAPAATGLDVRIRLRRPIVGLGAPVHFFLPAVAERLGAEAIIPAHADVANAIGAVTSAITVSRRVRIQPEDIAGYLVNGLPEAPRFVSFAAAHEYATTALATAVRDLARRAGTSSAAVRFQVDDRLATAADGREVFLERVITGEISGPPDLLTADPAALSASSATR